MRYIAEIAPPNSLILVMDQSIGVIPGSMEGSVVAATPSCIAIGTLSETDGATHVTLTDEALEMEGEPAFDGLLETPAQKVTVCSVLDELILELGVGHKQTRVRVWTNEQMEPSDIIILVSAPETKASIARE